MSGAVGVAEVGESQGVRQVGEGAGHVVEEDMYDVYVFRSYAEYAWAFIEKAARVGAEVKLFGAQGAVES